VTGRSDAEARKQAGLVIAGLAAVTLTAARLGIRCPIRAAFGIDCPGCGGTRALLALMHGDVPQAARENAAALLAGLVAAGYVIAPARVSQAAGVVRASAERYRVTRWWAHHPYTAACAAAGLWCLARNGSPYSSRIRSLAAPSISRRVPMSALASGFRPGLAKCDLVIRKSAFDLGGLGLSRVLSATSRRHFSSEE